MTTPYPKFAAKYICAAFLLICFAQYTWAQSPPVDLNIVAHQDDDILFMNPDILDSVVAGHRQVTVYITSGSLNDEAYARTREAGAIAGYQKLLQLADAIIADPNHFNDFTGSFDRDSRFPASCVDNCFSCDPHAVELSTPGTASVDCPTPCPLHIGSRDLAVTKIADGLGGPRVMLIFLRVQVPCAVDGNYTCPNQVDLAELFTSGDPQLQIKSDFPDDPHDPDYTPPYTKKQLIKQLVDILNFVQPNKVRTQDPAKGVVVDAPNTLFIPDLGCDTCAGLSNFYDHSDHVAGAKFARQAITRYDNLPNSQNQPTYFTYKGYNLEWNEAPRTRLSAKYFCLKKSILFNYALNDGQFALCSTFPAENGFNCFSYENIGYQEGQQRQSP